MLGVHEHADAGQPQQQDAVVHPQLAPGARRDQVGAVAAAAAEEHRVDGQRVAVRPAGFILLKQEKIALWTGVKGNGSIYDGDGTIGHGLTMDIEKGLSFRERT